ncbi:MAG TPA: hypothetical protein VHI52_12775, partial [Verrucomicrobiae bacterium]|nr:hypothetical protein [Verrucomicrobiae bacterium]
MHWKTHALICAGTFLFATAQALETEAQPEIPLRQALVLKSVSRAGRSAVHTDPIEASIVNGRWQQPALGEKVATPGGDREWESAATDKEGWLQPSGMRSGYVDWSVNSPHDQVMILEAAGQNLVYVNGEIRTGDPYAYGYVKIPVLLRSGTNDFLFQCSRGRLKAKLTEPQSNLFFNEADPTLPDVRTGERGPLKGAVVLVNASTHPVEAIVRSRGAKTAESHVAIPPLETRKAGFVFFPPRNPHGDSYTVRLEVLDQAHRGTILAHTELKLRVRKQEQTYKRTFLSSIDDSVQYYAVNPAPVVGANAPALFLSLHGASVEAIGQADAYSPKRWGNIVCPTNRRPYGFDWEEWGRLDAMEVLAQAQTL